MNQQSVYGIKQETGNEKWFVNNIKGIVCFAYPYHDLCELCMVIKLHMWVTVNESD